MFSIFSKSSFKLIQGLVALAVVLGVLLPNPQPIAAYTIPTFSILQVVEDTSVKIQTANFPAGQIFTVRMGKYGTLAVGGVVVATTNSGAGGAFQETYTIPDSLKGDYRIAIRMDSPDGYYSYNWFVNNTDAAPTPGSGSSYTGIPTFSILEVATDDTVKIRTNNFPKDQTFTVRMGVYGTLGVGGVVVATTNSGAGGAFEETYTIPDSLKGDQRIAIRMDSTAGYYAYNWFWNNTTSGGSSGGSGSSYTGIPTFSIQEVAVDDTVKIRTNNFPAGYEFKVRMGEYGTLGVGGVVVATTNSGAGGVFEETYTIPDSLKGDQRIAIRLEAAEGFYADNWFWNNTTSGGSSSGGSGSSYTGIPTFSIKAVVKDDTVTVTTNNFPADTDFSVRMGAYGTLAAGGVVVASFNSGSGGAFEQTFTIPDGLKGSSRIAIRADSSLGYYAYNWFWNNSTD